MMEKSSIDALRENLKEIEENISAACQRAGRKREEVTLMAVTKTVDVQRINEAISLGCGLIGENRVQEFLQKEPSLLPCRRHIIGHLQTNKVKQIAGRVDMIESVDSVRLAALISEESMKKGLVTDILVEVNIGNDENKSGIAPSQTQPVLREISVLQGVRVQGLMTIPPISEDKEAARKFFSRMRQLFIDIRDKKIDNINMSICSMGMSGDYDVAVEEGSTLVRIGSALFGARK